MSALFAATGSIPPRAANVVVSKVTTSAAAASVSSDGLFELDFDCASGRADARTPIAHVKASKTREWTCK